MGSSSNPRSIILDTHIWIWALDGNGERIDSKLRSLIESASEESLIRIAAISVWEVGMLEAKGRISLRIPCIQWIHNALSAPGCELIPFLPEIAVESSRLPGAFHGDPADRIIVASARLLDAILVTMDRRILEYAAQGYVRTA